MEIKLPKPILEGNKSVEECIYERESVRKYQNKAIEIEKISQILWAAQGKKGQKRTVPSAGATYPLEIYVTLKGKGYFHYNFKDHVLKLVTEENICKDLTEESWNQAFIEEAYLNILICADYSRTTQRYGERGIRYVHMEIGHAAQNVHLQVVSLNLGTVVVGAFNDNEVKRIMDMTDKEQPLCIMPIGRR